MEFQREFKWKEVVKRSLCGWVIVGRGETLEYRECPIRIGNQEPIIKGRILIFRTEGSDYHLRNLGPHQLRVDRFLLGNMSVI